MEKAEKSGLFTTAAISGVSRSFTKAVTTVPKAAPTTTPTARSTTLPRNRNCLNPLMEDLPRRCRAGYSSPTRRSTLSQPHSAVTGASECWAPLAKQHLLRRALLRDPSLNVTAKLRQWNYTLFQYNVVKLPQVELVAELALRFLPQGPDLQPARVIGGQLSGHHRDAIHDIVRGLGIEASGRNQVIDGLLPRPLERMQSRIDNHATRWPSPAQNECIFALINTGFFAHCLSVTRPTFHVGRIEDQLRQRIMRLQLSRQRYLQVMAGPCLMDNRDLRLSTCLRLPVSQLNAIRRRFGSIRFGIIVRRNTRRIFEIALRFDHHVLLRHVRD